MHHTARTGRRYGHAPPAPLRALRRKEEPGVTGDPDDLLTIDEVIAALRVSRAAFYRWRRRGARPGAGPRRRGAARGRRKGPAQRTAAVAAQPARRQPGRRGHRSMSTYDVKIWDPKKIGDTAKGRWRVRWAVAGREHCRSFAAKPLADGFIATLKAAIADQQPFDETTGLPTQPGHAARPRTWYDHARAYTEMKWPDQAATSRRSSADALTTVTIALAPRKRGAPDPEALRRAQ